MKISSNVSSFDEDKKIALIDAMGQLEALASSVNFKVKESPNNPRLEFYIATLFTQLIANVKQLVDELLAKYEKITNA